MKITLSHISIVFTLIVVTLVSSNLNFGKKGWQGILEADAKGYYAYLPALFIYDDLNFGFFDEIEKEKYYNENLFYEYRIGFNNKTINKYYCGTAIAELPFFLIAHGLTTYLELDADGYSRLYPISVNIAAIFYLLIGLIYLNKTLSLFQISEKHKFWTLLAAVFGTNLFYYTIGEPGLSHIYSFAFISMFMYFSKQYFITNKLNYIVLTAIAFGFIVLIRPINGVIVFALPFLAGSFDLLKIGLQKLLQHYWTFLLSSILFSLIVSIQLIIYKLSTGSFIVYSYGEEGFNFGSPHFLDILFSYKKGLFLYTPLFLVSLLGTYFLWKNNKFQFYSIALFLGFITYIFSSWWMWYYGGSFSSRVYIEYIPLFMILLGGSFQKINKKTFRNTFLAAIIGLIVLCQIQTYQYRYYQIHWVDMNAERYWDVFLRVDQL